MTSVATRSLAEAAVSTAMGRVLPAGLAGGDPLVRRSDFADFQSNVALALAKPARWAPRDLATALAREITEAGLDVSVSGPGFLNIRVTDAALWGRVAALLADDRLGCRTPLAGERVVVDYSGPNVAKELHVGHLRTTIIGDALARITGYLGADVVRQNHIGDWGTQFGMLIQYRDEEPDQSTVDDLYVRARARFDADPAFADRARARVVALQSGDPASLAIWSDLVAESTRAFQAVYDRLGLLLTPRDVDGESAYNPELAGIVDELVAKGIAVPSGGALCVFFDDVVGPDGQPVPLIVRKNDGGFGYAATDLAAIRHRILGLEATRILYVVDARQALHFRMVFDTAARAGWLTDGVAATHVPFGTVLKPDGRPFKTRAGDTVPLTVLLDAAVDRAAAILDERSVTMDPAERIQLARAVGIGAVKYADLSTSRTRDYVFDVDRMVSYDGNTGVYLQFARVRAQSILRRLTGDPTPDPTLPAHPAERALALALDGFADTVVETAETLEPHRLCGYLYALAKACTDFYESCPVLADTPARGNRVALCRLAARTLGRGLDLLGIEAPDRM